ncbi:MAG: phosphoglycerate dehydrogenase [Candidatus Tectomicrobia bacterium]|uniref:D-3-phosphoglycerate dehydrogenase n=1 Tax=Tectimicrobiota bacterium TaxID=2528274 RepID=A0A933GMQ0_UNCTE|nr:phosphoglycerate dehydrogenase [Candidatus Tectomicrobia bacterium]
MVKVLVSDKLSPRGIEIFKGEEGFEVDIKVGLTSQQIFDCISDYDALAVRSETKVTAQIINAAKRLKVIGRAGIGIDNVDLEAATKKGIVVMNTPGGNTITTAEHTISMMLALARKIPQANASMKNHLWEKGKFMGVEVYNKTLGIIGMGRIGSEVCKRAKGLGMNVIAFDPFISREMPKKLEVELVDLNELFRRSDFITTHTPLSSETRHIVNAQAFQLMKNGVRIINCARGGIIDEAALAEAIRAGKVAGAALDVFDHEPPLAGNPLVGLEQVICTPHLGASTAEAQENVAIAVAQQMVDYLKRGIISNAVNVPSLGPESLSSIRPFLVLAEKIGRLQAQLCEGRMEEVNLQYRGQIEDKDLSLVTVFFLKGLLETILIESVNYVNAPVLARERGIKVTETKGGSLEGYANLVASELKTDKGKSIIAGTLFNGDNPRLVHIDGFQLEAVLEGRMLIFSNVDKPGLIGSIGTALGNNNINIASMHFGREKAGGKAISVVRIDTPADQDVLTQLKHLPNVVSVKLVQI